MRETTLQTPKSLKEEEKKMLQALEIHLQPIEPTPEKVDIP